MVSTRVFFVWFVAKYEELLILFSTLNELKHSEEKF